MIKLFKKIFNRLFGYKWVCEYCGDIVYCMEQPFCKECCHVQRTDVKMIKIKK